MATKTNVYGVSVGVVHDLHPDEQFNWIVWGTLAEYGRVTWVSVKPFIGGEFLGPEYTGEKIITVTDWSYESTDDGGRRIFLSYKNTSNSIIEAHAISYAWTDVV